MEEAEKVAAAEWLNEVASAIDALEAVAAKGKAYGLAQRCNASANTMRKTAASLTAKTVMCKACSEIADELPLP